MSITSPTSAKELMRRAQRLPVREFLALAKRLPKGEKFPQTTDQVILEVAARVERFAA